MSYIDHVNGEDFTGSRNSNLEAEQLEADMHRQNLVHHVANQAHAAYAQEVLGDRTEPYRDEEPPERELSTCCDAPFYTDTNFCMQCKERNEISD